MRYQSIDNDTEPPVLDGDLKDLPKTVIETLRLDETEFQQPPSEEPHLLTFRYFFLSILFVIPGAFIDTMNSYRTTSAPYSILFVQFLSYPLGEYLSKVLPKKKIYPIPGSARFAFNLNPHPWSVKESVLVTLTAASGATGNQGTTGISLAQVYYNETISPIVALLFMYCIVWTGYSFAAIARNFVLYDPQFIWPQALMQTSLFKAQEDTYSERTTETDQQPKEVGHRGSSQIKIFSIGLVLMFLWEFLPEYIFPMTSSLAILCWMAPYNRKLNFLGSGLGGLGVLNISLDWSNITSSVMLSPYWTIVLQFIGFALTCWVALPFLNTYKQGKYSTGLMENRLLLGNGTVYPTLELITKDLKFNETAYELYGPVHMGSQKALNIFFDYAAYSSAIAWIIFFGFTDVKKTLIKLIDRYKNTNHLPNSHPIENNNNDFNDGENSPLITQPNLQTPTAASISSQYTDRVNRLYSHYSDVPTSWFLLLFTISFITLSSILLFTDQLFIPWKTYIVALTLGALIVTPMSYLYASSNFQLAIGTVNEVIYGIMIQNPLFSGSTGSKHPCGAAIYGAVSGNAWYRAQFLLQDQKIGMYNGIPPKLVFFSQIFGDLIGVPFNYIALRWVISLKLEYLNGSRVDSLHQWSGQSLTTYNSNAILYVLLGPKRLFELYPMLPYGFAFGIVAPLIIFIAWRYVLRWDILKWANTTIVFSTMSRFYGNISTGYFTQFLIGTFTMYYLFNFKHNVFKRYNYVLAAAFDTGFNLACLVLFFVFSTTGKKPFANWWGNDSTNIEKCYAL